MKATVTVPVVAVSVVTVSVTVHFIVADSSAVSPVYLRCVEEAVGVTMVIGPPPPVTNVHE